jgi:hypothetical protein
MCQDLMDIPLGYPIQISFTDRLKPVYGQDPYRKVGVVSLCGYTEDVSSLCSRDQRRRRCILGLTYLFGYLEQTGRHRWMNFGCPKWMSLANNRYLFFLCI